MTYDVCYPFTHKIKNKKSVSNKRKYEELISRTGYEKYGKVY